MIQVKQIKSKYKALFLIKLILKKIHLNTTEISQTSLHQPHCFHEKKIGQEETFKIYCRVLYGKSLLMA